jgi:hypothetical protein
MSSMMEWMNSGASAQMDKVIARRAPVLREQMREKGKSDEPKKKRFKSAAAGGR